MSVKSRWRRIFVVIAIPSVLFGAVLAVFLAAQSREGLEHYGDYDCTPGSMYGAEAEAHLAVVVSSSQYVRVTSRFRVTVPLDNHLAHSLMSPPADSRYRASMRCLLAWPPELELIDHLREAYSPLLDSASDEDIEAVLAVVRLTHGERPLRAAYLMLRERAEDALAEALAQRLGTSAAAIDVRVQAAAMSAVLKVATDDIARASADGITRGALDAHREQIAGALRGLSVLL